MASKLREGREVVGFIKCPRKTHLGHEKVHQNPADGGKDTKEESCFDAPTGSLLGQHQWDGVVEDQAEEPSQSTSKGRGFCSQDRRSGITEICVACIRSTTSCETSE